MIGGQWVDLVDPFAKALNNFLARPLETGDTDARGKINRLLDEGQIVRSYIADDGLFANAEHSLQSLGYLGGHCGAPRWSRRFFVCDARAPLTAEKRG
jgi:hypothetical protein